MIRFKPIYKVLLARMREFYRDKASLYWNLVLPFFIIFVFYFIFGSADQPVYKVGVVGTLSEKVKSTQKFFQMKYIQFLPQEKQEGLRKVQNHKLAMLIEIGNPTQYWVNSSSKEGYLVEELFTNSYIGPVKKKSIPGNQVRYLDWVFPGILVLNIMFSCLWGTGWVIVKYRDEGYLKRLHASPLRVYQFILGQVGARLIIVTLVTSFLFVTGSWIIDFDMQGSYFNLFICYLLGALSLIAMGVLVATRTTNKEFADGVLNVFSWPMMLLSGMWFSMEGVDSWLHYVSYAMPLTHLIEATRRVMLEGATLVQIAPHLGLMLVFSICLYIIIFLAFKWNER